MDRNGTPPSDSYRSALEIAAEAHRQAKEEQRRFNDMVRTTSVSVRPPGLPGLKAVEQVRLEQLQAAREMERIRAGFAGVGTIAEAMSKSLAKQFAGMVDARQLFAISGIAEAMAKSLRPPVFDIPMPKITTGFEHMAAACTKDITAGWAKAWMPKDWMPKMTAFDFPKPAFEFARSTLDFPEVEARITPDLGLRHARAEFLAEAIGGPQWDTAKPTQELVAVTRAEQGTLATLAGAVVQLVEAQAAAQKRQDERDAANTRREWLRTGLTILALAVSAVGTIYAGLAYRHGTSVDRDGPAPPATVAPTPPPPPSTTTTTAPLATAPRPSRGGLPTQRSIDPAPG